MDYFRIRSLQEQGLGSVDSLPFSIKILLEALLRCENGSEVTAQDIENLASYRPENPGNATIPFKPARVLLQDFTGVPCVVDLAAMRSEVARRGGDPGGIHPEIPVDLVIDHSLQVDFSAAPDACANNTAREFERNAERYRFLAWGQKAFNNFRVIPPSCGICHQINLEYLAAVVQHIDVDGRPLAFPDSLVGTDSHSTMINGLGVAGWGVGGIEAEAAMLGQPLSIPAPPVIGFRLSGRLTAKATATDLVLRITEMLRTRGVVGSFVEFFGPGLNSLSVPDRATVANMAPEYGATMGFFPVDAETITFLRNTGRPAAVTERAATYCKAQGLFREEDTPPPVYSDVVELDLASVRQSLAGPSRPQDRIDLSDMKTSWKKTLAAAPENRGFGIGAADASATVSAISAPDNSFELTHGSVILASITSCTNTSNPDVMLAAGLLARNACRAGLQPKPWVKTSMIPGSTVVTRYLDETGLLPFLEQLGFHVAGYGCATCIGNSGPLDPAIEKAVSESGIVTAGVVSGNRNFEGRLHPLVRASFLASPPLVVAYALAGTVDIDLTSEPLGTIDGNNIHLDDIWPADDEIECLAHAALNPELYCSAYSGIEQSNDRWNRLSPDDAILYAWDESSTYIREPGFFSDMPADGNTIRPIESARVLLKVGDSITTDHISPAGAIPVQSPAGAYLIDQGVQPGDFNSYGSRRGNHHVMTRGTFSNIRLRNQLAPGTEGGWTTCFINTMVTSIYDAACLYRDSGIPTIVLAGRDYGMGSSRDWAAKGTGLLGVRTVLAVSFERIHRSNLVGMGVLPLQFLEGDTADTLGLTGKESFTICIDGSIQPAQRITVIIERENGDRRSMEMLCRLDTATEVAYYKNGGILKTVLKKMQL